MAIPNLDVRAVRQIRRGMLKGIQDYKISLSKGGIRGLQGSEKLPPDEYITSYVTSTNPNNRYVDLDKFFVNMERSYVKNWRKKFIFLSSDFDNSRIAEAAAFAYNLIIQRTVDYPDPRSKWISTGHLKRSVRMLVGDHQVTPPGRHAITGSEEPIVTLMNIAEYGSTAEAKSYFRDGGLVYYAARRTQTKFPELGILFIYAKAQEFGLPHIYDIPTLVISTPANATGKWARPGTRARRRARGLRRIQRRSGV